MLAGEGLWEIKMEAGVQPLPQDFCERRKSGTGSALAKKKKKVEGPCSAPELRYHGNRRAQLVRST